MATIVDGRTLPFDWYSNPDVLRLERERIFRSAWQYAGRADQVAEPGSFFTCDAAGVRSSSSATRKGRCARS